MNPWDAVGTFVVALIKERKIEAWWKLLFQIFASGILSFMSITGAQLAAGVRPSISIGIGLITSAAIMTYFIRQAQGLLKGMTFVLPAEEAKTEMHMDVQVITKDK